MNILHINSYYITNKVHSEFVSKLSDCESVYQTIYVPITSQKSINKNKIERANRIAYKYSKCISPYYRFILPLRIWLIWRDLKASLKAPPDLVHAHSLFTNGSIAFIANRSYKIPYIVTVRNTDINHYLKKANFLRIIAEKILSNASAVICISPVYKEKHLKRYLSKNVYDRIKDKTFVYPNGINDYWIKNCFNKNSLSWPIQLIFVGRIVNNKNLDGVIKAIQLLTKQGKKCELTVVGGGPKLNYFKSLHVDFRINFLGWINDYSELSSYYRSCDILVVPSHKESFGLIYAEALSQGLPVIYTQDQGFDGFFPDGYCGYAVKSKDPQSIAEKIFRVVENYSLITNNIKNIRSQFSWNEVIIQYINLYNSILR